MVAHLKEEMDFYGKFKKYYYQIVKDFNYDYEKDCEARDYFSMLLGKKKDWDLESVLKLFKEQLQEKSNIIIFGCGPSLETTVEILLKKKGKKFFKNSVNLAADGASIFLREKKIHINSIFTDLDGITKEEFYCTNFMVIHAHGDNIDRLKHFKEEIFNFKNIIATTQVEPLKNLLNSGGFTDGDRILYFLRTLLLPKHELFLIGMDFKNIVGKYSKPELIKNEEGSPIKIKKLQYAIKLIENLKDIFTNEIYFVNSEIASENFTYLSIEELMNMNVL
ncbi:MAG: 6-hydroxymethylpterin diphosphokinase MptE-like protein [Promethearchaeota archaeon]